VFYSLCSTILHNNPVDVISLSYEIILQKIHTIALEEGGIGGVPTRMKKREMNNENMKNGELFS